MSELENGTRSIRGFCLLRFFITLSDDKLLSGVVSGLWYGSQTPQPPGDSPHPKFTLRKICTQDTQAFDTAGGSKLALIGRLTSCLSLRLVLISSFHFLSILFLTPRVKSCAHFSDFSFPDCPLHTLISASYRSVPPHTWFSKCTACFPNYQHLRQLSVFGSCRTVRLSPDPLSVLLYVLLRNNLLCC